MRGEGSGATWRQYPRCASKDDAGGDRERTVDEPVGMITLLPFIIEQKVRPDAVVHEVGCEMLAAAVINAHMGQKDQQGEHPKGGKGLLVSAPVSENCKERTGTGARADDVHGGARDPASAGDLQGAAAGLAHGASGDLVLERVRPEIGGAGLRRERDSRQGADGSGRVRPAERVQGQLHRACAASDARERERERQERESASEEREREGKGDSIPKTPTHRVV